MLRTMASILGRERICRDIQVGEILSKDMPATCKNEKNFSPKG